MSDTKEKSTSGEACHRGNCVDMHQFCFPRCCILRCLVGVVLLGVVFAAGFAMGACTQRSHHYYGYDRHEKYRGGYENIRFHTDGISVMPMRINAISPAVPAAQFDAQGDISDVDTTPI